MRRIEKIKSVLLNIKESGEIDEGALNGLTKSEKEMVFSLYEENLITEGLLFLEELDTDKEWQQLLQRKMGSKKSSSNFVQPYLKYAAIVIAFLSVGYFLVNDKDDKPFPISEMAIKLKVGDNDVKVLKKGESQQIVSSTGKILGIQQDDKITYSPDSDIEELIYNELEVPFGKIFNVELSDGTVVHLNSGSKLRYPVKFLKKTKREVFIEGEAYFKVSKDTEHPFIVHANEVAVEVLGTEFNVSSYEEDKEINTILVEGSVSISNSISPEDNIVIKPGIKATWDKQSYATKTENVDVNLYTGWIDGKLRFRSTLFSDMQKKLERSYNVSITNYNTELANKKLNAHFNVNIESIEDVMKSIGEIYPLKYEISGEEITIQ
ncbi:FecR family protein [Zobellia alginiliquefaciens]|uniref:FecR family protein n=1 Tax=Zobellia alginiliquefaciens TaxID=3032586 RepID=UPI0023E2FEC2|nr:FecR domain-containing protein [Zobellia alginiliquefaciens]